MTELAEAPAVEPGGAITRIPHWIGGKRVDGNSGRSGAAIRIVTTPDDGSGEPVLAYEHSFERRGSNP